MTGRTGRGRGMSFPSDSGKSSMKGVGDDLSADFSGVVSGFDELDAVPSLEPPLAGFAAVVLSLTLGASEFVAACAASVCALPLCAIARPRHSPTMIANEKRLFLCMKLHQKKFHTLPLAEKNKTALDETGEDAQLNPAPRVNTFLRSA